MSASPDYNEAELLVADHSTPSDPSADEPVSKGELLSIGGLFDRVKYRYKGVDTYQNVLRLEAENAQEDEYSLQIGHRFQPFATTEFRSGDSIRLADFRGKYLFVDFWGTWCGGCVAELPELEKIYAGVDTSRVGFVSIAGGQDPKKLTSFLQKQPLAWPQIISDNKNKLVETYHIINYPTNVLIGPDGRVVARNLHGKVLADRLSEVLKR